MRNLTRIAVAALLLAALPAGAKGGKSRGHGDGTHKALVIGVANYSGIWPKLDNPLRDAKAMDAKLTAMGYTVRRLLDPTGEEMDTAASEFTRSLRDGDTAVFFYAGHGVQVDNANYLIPRDFTADTEVSVKHRAFPLSDVVESIERSEGVAGLVIDGHCQALTLERVFAKVLLIPSNSMIERFRRQLKHGWLFLHTLDSLAELERLTRWYVEQHNSVMPHFALDGQTPDEMYFGTGVAVPGAWPKPTRRLALSASRSTGSFNAPPAARLPTSRRPRRIPWKSRSAALAYGGLQDVRSRGTAADVVRE